MSRNTMNVTKGIITGLIVGGTVGMIAASAHPKKSRAKRNAGKALDALGAIIQSAADFTMG